MYVVISKIAFNEMFQESERRELAALSDKIKKKFQVQVKPLSQRGSENTLVIADIGHSEHSLGQKLDQIADYCEDSGYGRIESEMTFLDDLENLFQGEPS